MNKNTIELKKIIRLKNSQFSNEVAFELGLGAVVTGYSLLDIYNSVEDHSEVFKVISSRFPREMGSADRMGWVSKVSELNAGGEHATNAYVSAYVGEKGELASIERLSELNYSSVRQFEAKNYAHDDLVALDTNGNEVRFSVKSYEDKNSFYKEVKENTVSDSYVINSELFDELSKNGKIIEYKNSGINIIDGQFSHIENKETAIEAFNNVNSAMDFSDSLSFLSFYFAGSKIVDGVSKFHGGSQSAKELVINTSSGVSGVFAKYAGAQSGVYVGAKIGTAVLPGVGTIVGSLGGAALGAMSASTLVEHMKNEAKWGDIVGALDHFGRIFLPCFDLGVNRMSKKAKKLLIEQLGRTLFSSGNIQDKILKERATYLSRVGIIYKLGLRDLSLNDCLSLEHISDLHRYRISRERTVLSIVNRIEKDLVELGGKFGRKRLEVFLVRVLGEIIIENIELFTSRLTEDDSRFLKLYSNQKEKCPNHPYRISKYYNLESTRVYIELLMSWNSLSKKRV